MPAAQRQNSTLPEEPKPVLGRPLPDHLKEEIGNFL